MKKTIFLLLILFSVSPVFAFTPYSMVNVKDKPMVDIREFSADRTGTTDCSAAITKAIASCTALGIHNIYFPSGLYKLTSANTITTDNICFYGDGASSVIFSSTALSPALFQVESDNVSFVGLTLRGAGTVTASPTPERGIRFYECSGGLVEKCDISSVTVGVQLENASNSTVTHSNIHHMIRNDIGQGGYGILENGPNNYGNQFVGNIFTSIGRHAIYVSKGARASLIQGNKVNGCGADAISVYSLVADNTINGTKIIDNDIRNVTNQIPATVGAVGGIGVSQNVTDVEIAGNYIYDIGSMGVRIDADGTSYGYPLRINIHDNNIASTVIGVDFYNADYCKIVNNDFYNVKEGVYLRGYPPRIANGNTVTGNTVASFSLCAFEFSQNFDGLIFGNNNIGSNPVAANFLINDASATRMVFTGRTSTHNFITPDYIVASTGQYLTKVASSGRYLYPVGQRVMACRLTAKLSEYVASGTLKIYPCFDRASATPIVYLTRTMIGEEGVETTFIASATTEVGCFVEASSDFDTFASRPAQLNVNLTFIDY